MVSTFLSYRLYTADLSKSVSRTLSDVQVSREATYYRENIGKVKSVDDFLKDQRLYAYAMKAYGLEDMTYAKAFMRKVLESDLTQADSFVRKLVDQRYLTFARAFNFMSTGDVDPGFTLAQDSADEAETIGLYSEQRVLKGQAVATEVEYYQSRMATLSSVDQFIGDSRLFSFALKAHGIDPDIASEAAIRAVLVSDLSDPASVANSFNDARYQRLAAAFSFGPDGSVPAPGEAQTLSQLESTIYLHYEMTGNGMSPAASAFKTTLFQNLIGSVTSVDAFLANAALRDYALVAVGLDPVLASDITLRAVLVSDLSDPTSPANALGANTRMLASAFNFNADGLLDDGVSAQTSAQTDALVDLYLANYDGKARTAEQTQTDYFKSAMDLVFSVDDLLNDTRLFNYVLNAFGLDPADEARSKIRQVLTSNLTDGTSFANRLRDSRYTALAEAFNFDANGMAQGVLRGQLASSKSDTVARFTATLGELEVNKTRGKIETDYYSATIDGIRTVDDLIKDKRLVAYIKTAYGLERETISDSTLRQALTSDLFDPKSFVNRSENYKLREMAAAFNFAADGTVKRVAVGQAQDSDDLLRTQDLYIRQTMEQQAGAENQGVRLALYFQRKASTIVSAYSVLADKALLEVVLTALNLPDSVAQADVDTQAKLIAKRFDLADFKDPAKVEKFLARFTALYDLKNPQSAPSIPSLLLGQQQSADFGLDVLTSIQSLRRRM